MGSYKSLSFFSGALGLDLGLEEAGIHASLFCEIDKSCQKTIYYNRPDTCLINDILRYSTKEIKKLALLGPGEHPTIIVGGPPCQAFSTAGKRKAFEDPRGNVLLKYLEIIEELGADYVVIENVRGLLSAALKHTPIEKRGKKFYPTCEAEIPGSVLAYILERLKDIGYSVNFNLYNTANFGCPQIRERVVIIGSRKGEQVPFLEPTHAECGIHGLRPWRTFKDAVLDLENPSRDCAKFPEERLRYYRLLGPGQYWKHLPEELQKEALGKSYYSGGGKTGFLRRIAWDRPSPTLVTYPAMPATDLAHPVEERPLSTLEYARIQEFPDNWKFSGTIIDKYRQIGNAVPVGLGRAIGTAIIKDINGQSPKIPLDFNFSRYKNTEFSSWQSWYNKQKELLVNRNSKI